MLLLHAEPLARRRDHPPPVVPHVPQTLFHVLRQVGVIVGSGQEESPLVEIRQRHPLPVPQGSHFVLGFLPLGGLLALLPPGAVLGRRDGVDAHSHVLIPAEYLFLADVVASHPAALLLALHFRCSFSSDGPHRHRNNGYTSSPKGPCTPSFL